MRLRVHMSQMDFSIFSEIEKLYPYLKFGNVTKKREGTILSSLNYLPYFRNHYIPGVQNADLPSPEQKKIWFFSNISSQILVFLYNEIEN